MTYLIVSEDYIDDLGCWMKFGYLACNTCGARVPSEGVVEVGEIAHQTRKQGWTSWPYSDGPYDACRECRVSPFAALQEDAR